MIEQYINKVVQGNCLELLEQLPDDSIDLICTSPPYNVGKDYGDEHDDNQSFDDYFAFISSLARSLLRVTTTGGRLCLNVPFTGNSWTEDKQSHLQFYPGPYINIFKEAGWIYRDLAIWTKTRVPENPNSFCGNSTRWGSWQSCSNPILICFSEAILVFHKEVPKLQGNGTSDITKEEFLTFTKNTWYFPPETSANHPAAFPVELPYRCIKLYSYVNALVLDPFMGSGSTALACIKTNRRFIGFELNKEYVQLARDRIYLATQPTLF